MITIAPSRLQLLKAGRRNRKVIAWPGRPDQLVGVQPLVGSESQQAKLRALEGLPIYSTGKDSGGIPAPLGAGLVTRELYEEALVFEILFFSLVDPDSGERFAASPMEMRELVDLDEAELLMTAYEAACAECSPHIDDLEQAEKDAERLGEASPPGMSSSTCSPSARRTFSGGPQSTSPTDNSSTCSPSPSPSPRAPAAAAGDPETPDDQAVVADSSPGSTTTAS